MDLDLPWQPDAEDSVNPPLPLTQWSIDGEAEVNDDHGKNNDKGSEPQCSLIKDIKACIQRIIHPDEARFTPGNQGWFKARNTNRL